MVPVCVVQVLVEDVDGVEVGPGILEDLLAVPTQQVHDLDLVGAAVHHVQPVVWETVSLNIQRCTGCLGDSQS